MESRSGFTFDGGPATYWGTALLRFLVTVCTAGLAYPYALVLGMRWQTRHSFIEGRPLHFNGTGWGLFGNWLKWWALTIITAGIYSFWVAPKIQKWKWEHVSFAA